MHLRMRDISRTWASGVRALADFRPNRMAGRRRHGG